MAAASCDSMTRSVANCHGITIASLSDDALALVLHFAMLCNGSGWDDNDSGEWTNARDDCKKAIVLAAVSRHFYHVMKTYVVRSIVVEMAASRLYLSPLFAHSRRLKLSEFSVEKSNFMFTMEGMAALGKVARHYSRADSLDLLACPVEHLCMVLQYMLPHMDRVDKLRISFAETITLVPDGGAFTSAFCRVVDRPLRRLQIGIGGSKMTDEVLAHVANFGALETAECWGSKVTRFGLLALRKCRLRGASFAYCRVTFLDILDALEESMDVLEVLHAENVPLYAENVTRAERTSAMNRIDKAGRLLACRQLASVRLDGCEGVCDKIAWAFAGVKHISCIGTEVSQATAGEIVKSTTTDECVVGWDS